MVRGVSVEVLRDAKARVFLNRVGSWRTASNGCPSAIQRDPGGGQASQRNGMK
jgi:hypothetical protein